ncbi:MAG: hypothetical protein KGH98_01800, partial [Candidatus Micrarchaeota archaeon]|nr:hypothetical protein [Candidatus Micrarchaeota archaeon]
MAEDIKEELTKRMDRVNFKTLVTREGVMLAANLWESCFRDERYCEDVLWGLKGNCHRNFAVL